MITRAPFLLLQIISPLCRPKAKHPGHPETALALPRRVVTSAPIQSIRKPGPSSVAQRCSLPKTDRIQSFFLSCIQERTAKVATIASTGLAKSDSTYPEQSQTNPTFPNAALLTCSSASLNRSKVPRSIQNPWYTSALTRLRFTASRNKGPRGNFPGRQAEKKSAV